jgi:hypothetical protein
VNAMSSRHAGSGPSRNSRNSRKRSRSNGLASSKQHVKLIRNCQRCKTSDPIRQCPASNKFCADCGRPNVTDHAVEQQDQEQSPEQPRSASNTQQLPDGSSGTVTLSGDDQFVVADTDAIGLGYDAEVSDLPPHIQSKIFSVVSQTSRAHLNGVA